MKTLVMSLGGSIIVPGEIDVEFLKHFRQVILDFVSKGNRVVLVCGGGKTARKYSDAAKELIDSEDSELDLIGIRATKINAELVRVMFSKDAYKEVVENPTKKIKTTKKIIVASGWVPGFSSDMDAVLLAKNLGAKRVVNLSNIAYAYTKDPHKFKDAVKIKEISWKEFQKIVGVKWIANTSFPFDPEASKKAKKFGLEVIITKGTDLKNLRNILNDEKFKGTIIR
jgi:uridylate kinase